MACLELIGDQPTTPTGVGTFPVVYDAATRTVTTTSTAPTSIYSFTWPGLEFISTLYALPAGGIDATRDPDGSLFYAHSSGATLTIYREATSIASISGFTGGGGIAYADGWLWVIVNKAGGGNLYRVDPDSGASTLVASDALDFGSRPIAATDGSVWWTRSNDPGIFRHMDGVTASSGGLILQSMLPRNGGAMVAWDEGAVDWVEFDASLNVGPPSCDPGDAGLNSPLWAFGSTDNTVHGLMFFFGGVWATRRAGRWWAGVAGWT